MHIWIKISHEDGRDGEKQEGNDQCIKISEIFIESYV